MVILVIPKEKSMHSGELYVFAIAVYSSKPFSVHFFDLISLPVYHSGTLLTRLKRILTKRISQPLVSFRDRVSQLEHLV